MTRLLTLFLLTGAAPLAIAQGTQRAKVSAVLNQATVAPGQDVVVAIVLEIQRGFHAQSHKPNDPNLIALTITPSKDSGVSFGDVVFPEPTTETYPGLSPASVFTGKATFFIPVKIPEDARPGPLTTSGTIRYQICDDKGICFPPERKTWSVETKVVAKGEATEANAPDVFRNFKPTARVSRGGPATAASMPTTKASSAAGPPPVTVVNQSKISGFAMALGTAFVAGILFNIVPCVLPVLPIKVLGFAEVAQHDRGKTVLLASVFGVGIVTVFAVLGVFILILKKFTWGQQFSNPWFAWFVVAALLLGALWLFAVLNVNLPSAAYAFAPRHDTYVGNFEWGILTAALSTPCTGPLFIPVMGWAAQQPPSQGMAVMMMVGVGMAFPYIALSVFPEAARKFPRVGPWAELFKQMLGFMLLGFAVYFAAGRFSPAAGWWGAVPVAALAAIYLMARTVQLTKEARPVAISAVIAVVLLTATVLTACMFTGVFDRRVGSVAGVNWQPYSDETIEAARKAGKIVLVKFTANWCLNCQYVEATVFHDDQAIEALRKSDVVTVKADLTAEDAPGWERLRKLNPTGGIPLTAIYAPGYEQPVLIDSVYTTGTLVKALEQLARERSRGAAIE